MELIYVENSIKQHPRAQAILKKFKDATVIECEHYGEIFNLKAQNFRLQKQKPALILAEKKNNLVLPTPEGFGIGGEQNYYFSHMLNCVYDCRYCFLQGMYHSANYVVFVNYEDFQDAIKQTLSMSVNKSLLNLACKNTLQSIDSAYFFSGYDCDSLAYEPITKFVENFLPFFANYPQAILELRTKSTNIKALLKQEVIQNCVIAFSFTPEEISVAVEHKVPSVSKRIAAMNQLAKQGWKIGLRFDPLIYKENFTQQYQQLLANIFQELSIKQIHSVSIGPMRFPVKMYQKLVNLYPSDKLLAQPLERRNQNMTYTMEKENEMKKIVLTSLANYLDEALIFECYIS